MLYVWRMWWGVKQCSLCMPMQYFLLRFWQMSRLPICASVQNCSRGVLAAAGASNLLLVSFTNAGGLTMALNWALHLRRLGVPPVLGIDGPVPARWGSVAEDAAWHEAQPLLFRISENAEARNGLERWRLRWSGPCSWTASEGRRDTSSCGGWCRGAPRGGGAAVSSRS